MSTVWGVYRQHQPQEQPWEWLLFELHFADEKVEAQKGQELRNSLRAAAASRGHWHFRASTA